MVRRVSAAFRNLIGGGPIEADVDAELVSAIELLADERQRQGVSASDAHRQATIELGGIDQVKERLRDARAGAGIESAWRDVRFALRTFRREPVVAVVAIAALALGIGATTTVYSWARRALLEPLPGVPRQHELVVVATSTSTGRPDMVIPMAVFNDLRRHQRAFDGLSGSTLKALSFRHDGDVEQLWGGVVAGDFFKVLGTTAAHGRLFGADDSPGAAAVVVISDALWRTRFDADPAVVGRVITLNETVHTVIGVTPPGFVGGEPAIAQALWVPARPAGPFAQSVNDEVYGRLKPGITKAQAAASLAPLVRELEKRASGTTRRTLALFPLWQAPGGSTEILRPLIAILGGVVALVLVLTCANVSTLLLTHAAGRQHELGVRAALGAGRWRLVRQIGTESLLLAWAGGVAGVVVAGASSRLLLAFIPPLDVPIQLALGLNWNALGFAAAITLLTALLVGVVPAVTAASAAVRPSLNTEAAAAAGRRGHTTIRDTLVVAQVALSLALLVGAGLFLRSVANVGSLEPGFEPRNLLVTRIALGPAGHGERSGLALFGRLLERAGAAPGVQSVSLASRIPLSPFDRFDIRIAIGGHTTRDGEEQEVALEIVGPDYFRVLQIPIRDGREFSAADLPGRPPIAIVNEAACRYWLGGDPVGRKFRLGRTSFTVVGIAGNVKRYSADQAPGPSVYIPALQHYLENQYLIVRTAGDPAAVAPALRRALHSVDRTFPVSVAPMTEHLRLAFFPQRVGVAVLSVVGLVAMLLTALGLYGVVSYSVWRRVRELGVRIALGASPAGVRWLVVRHGARLLAIGAPIGMLGAAGLGVASRSQLYGVSPVDPLSFVGALAVLAVVAAAASAVPAWRASHLNIARALRNQ